MPHYKNPLFLNVRLYARKKSPAISNAITIANALQISLDELVGRTAKSPTYILNEEEAIFLQKYRKLDLRGKKAVIEKLEREYNYVEENP